MKYTYWSFLWNKQFHFQSNGAQPASHPKQWWKTINLFSIKKKEHNEPLSCWMIATVGHCLISLAAFLKKSSRMVSLSTINKLSSILVAQPFAAQGCYFWPLSSQISWITRPRAFSSGSSSLKWESSESGGLVERRQRGTLLEGRRIRGEVAFHHRHLRKSSDMQWYWQLHWPGVFSDVFQTFEFW